MRKSSKRLASLALTLVMALSLCVPAFAEEGGPSADLLDAAGTSVTESLLMDNSVYTLQHWIMCDDQSTEAQTISLEELDEPESHDFTYLYALPLGATLKMDLPEAQYVYVYAYTNNGKDVYPQRQSKVVRVGGAVSAELMPADISGPLTSIYENLNDDATYYAGAFLLNGSDNVRISGYDLEGECELKGTVSLTGDYLTNLFGANTIVEVELSSDLIVCLYLTGETLGSTSAAPAEPDESAAPSTPAPAPAFTDVAATSAFAPAISWAVEQGITTGKTSTTFAPSEQCTNGQILTFLWRANGSPEPTISNPFQDSIPNSFQKAAIWASEKGLVTGSTFGSGTPCTRSMVVTYLWQLAGSPAPDRAADFPDVAADAAYAQAVAWAVENGITTGKTDGTFAPDEVCTRGQIVTFIYRDFAR